MLESESTARHFRYHLTQRLHFTNKKPDAHMEAGRDLLQVTKQVRGSSKFQAPPCSYCLKFLGRLGWPVMQEKPALRDDSFLKESAVSSLLSP